LNGVTYPRRFPTNRQNNQKYNVLTLIPVVLFNQFKFFYNFFFLMIALSQFIPELKVGLMITYIAPLVFVLAITIFKEAFDDLQRNRKDRELNNKKYS
jgi:phospholipid-translocating ATPase